MTVTACERSESPSPQQSTTPPLSTAPAPPAPAATPAPPPAPVTTPAPTEPAALTVSEINLGKQIDDKKRVQQKVTTFAPNDTIYASVVTKGSTPSATLSAKWMAPDGQIVGESTQTITPTSSDVAEFHISKSGGWPTGTYKLEVYLNGQMASTKEFEVKG